MKILELSIKNLRKIEAIDLTPDSNVVMVEGKNNNGKTTVLDSILIALGGGKIPEGVIKKGEDKAQVIVKFGDYIVKKTITETNSYLSVETKDGMKPKNPQGFLSDLVGRLAFDPMEFMRMESKKQVDILKKALGVEDAINKLKLEESTLMDERKFIGREKEKYKLLIPNTIEKVEEPKNNSDLVRSIQFLLSNKNILEVNLQEKRKLLKEVEENKNRISQLLKEIESLQITNKEKLDEIDGFDFDKIESEIKDIDYRVDEKNNELKNQDEVIKKWNTYKEFISNKSEFEKVSEKYNKLDEKIKIIRSDMQLILENANIPIEGLELTDDCLMYNGHSFENTCESSKLKISIALCMSMNPKLKVILIRDGSLLDNNSLQEIKDIANKEDYQLWIEVIKEEPSDNDNAIFIVDGAIK